ncbi:hypothetical protein [Archangium sp.]|uniref:hypothetical protein n=1 Tax=Archangium sp. TaxID=1872627 RepID=UPI00286A03FE|nr:hypothetical protein [Archangium sp.]
MEPKELPGLERLLELCQRLQLGLKTSPPARVPVVAGSLMEGAPFDPVLAKVYARLGHAAFATKVMRWVLTRSDDQENRLAENNRWWRETYWGELGMPVIVFGGEVYSYATVPSLADEWGRQPVVEVNTYELDGLHVLPVASNVDRFFDSYSRYLEAVVASPRYQEAGENGILFPTHMGDLLARDERLVELLRSGRFESLMKNLDAQERQWVAKVMGARE